MKVTTDTYGMHDDGPDVIVVRLDDGTEIGAHCIVDNPEQERAGMEWMLKEIIREAVLKYGNHTKDCGQRGTLIPMQCTCGYRQAIAKEPKP